MLNAHTCNQKKSAQELVFNSLHIKENTVYRGSNISAHDLFNLLNELRKWDKMRGLPSISSLFRNSFNKFNNTRAPTIDSIYLMTLRLL